MTVYVCVVLGVHVPGKKKYGYQQTHVPLLLASLDSMQ